MSKGARVIAGLMIALVMIWGGYCFYPAPVETIPPDKIVNPVPTELTFKTPLGEWKVFMADSILSEGEDAWGMTVSTERRIYVWRELTGEFLETVLLHELCHVAHYDYNMDPYSVPDEFCTAIAATFKLNLVPRW